jgi:hypothetical protein
MKLKRVLIVVFATTLIQGCPKVLKERLPYKEVMSNFPEMVKSSFNWKNMKQGWQSSMDVLGLSKTKSPGSAHLNHCSELLINAQARGMSLNKINKLIRDNGC